MPSSRSNARPAPYTRTGPLPILGDADREQLKRTAIGAFTLARDADPSAPAAARRGPRLFLLERSLYVAERVDRVGHGVALALNGLEGFQRLTDYGALVAIAVSPAGLASSWWWCSRDEGHEPAQCRAARAAGGRGQPPTARIWATARLTDEMDTRVHPPPSSDRGRAAKRLGQSCSKSLVKRDIIAGLGVYQPVTIPFDEEFSQKG